MSTREPTCRLVGPNLLDLPNEVLNNVAEYVDFTESSTYVLKGIKVTVPSFFNFLHTTKRLRAVMHESDQTSHSILKSNPTGNVHSSNLHNHPSLALPPSFLSLLNSLLRYVDFWIWCLQFSTISKTSDGFFRNLSFCFIHLQNLDEWQKKRIAQKDSNEPEA